jgi:predicted neutral ceramidase superfamily lipid hydrolase
MVKKHKNGNWGFHKEEIAYILASAVFAIVWFMFVVPGISVMQLNPYIQFVIFNLGVYAFLVIFLKSIITKTKLDLVAAAGIIILFIALDFWMPEYHVTMTGQLLTGAELGTSASDYVAGVTGSSAGIHGTPLFLFVYVIIPIALLAVAAKLIPNFVRKL